MAATTTYSHPLFPLPSWFFFLRIAQLVVAIIILGLQADIGYWYDQLFGSYTSTTSGAIGISLFASCLTILFCIYYFVATLSVHNIFNVWALLALEITAVVFWLISFALLANSVADLNDFNNYYSCRYYYGSYCSRKRSTIVKRDTTSGVVDASLAFAIIEWILFIVSLVIVSLSFHRLRRSGTTGTTAAVSNDRAQEAQVAEAQPAVEMENAVEHK